MLKSSGNAGAVVTRNSASRIMDSAANACGEAAAEEFFSFSEIN